jgi:alpha-1,6-mannosyltransferase
VPETIERSLSDAKLRRAILWAGVVCATAFGAATVLSWLLAPFAAYEGRPYGQYEFFARIADSVPWLQDRLRDGWSSLREGIWLSLRGRGLFESRGLFLVTYSAPLIGSSLAALGLLAIAWRHRSALRDSDVDRVWRWGVVFAVLCIPAVPVLVPDFWLSMAWGRTLAAGINPYYDVPAAATSWLPIDAPIMRMTYGPLWAYVSAAVMKLTGGHALWGALGFKVVLAGMWVALLALVRTLVRDRTPFEQVLALIMVGWIPIGVVQTIGDGHNDVAMMGCALLWLHLRRSGRPMAATLALTASVLFKYASAPLFILDALYREPEETREVARFIRAYLPRAILAGLVTVAAFAPVFRGLDFFASTTGVHDGRFFLPSDAVLALGALTHLPLRPLAYVAVGIFPLITALALYRYLRDGGSERLRETAAAVMLSMLMVGSSHAWPWYMLWFLAFAATAPASGYGRWATGLALTMPYPLLVWTVWPYATDLKKFFLPSLLAYGLALGWFRLVRWRSHFVPPSRPQISVRRPDANPASATR